MQKMLIPCMDLRWGVVNTLLLLLLCLHSVAPDDQSATISTPTAETATSSNPTAETTTPANSTAETTTPANSTAETATTVTAVTTNVSDTAETAVPTAGANGTEISTTESSDVIATSPRSTCNGTNCSAETVTTVPTVRPSQPDDTSTAGDHDHSNGTFPIHPGPHINITNTGKTKPGANAEKTASIIGGVVAGFVVIFGLLALTCFVYHKKFKKKQDNLPLLEYHRLG